MFLSVVLNSTPVYTTQVPDNIKDSGRRAELCIQFYEALRVKLNQYMKGLVVSGQDYLAGVELPEKILMGMRTVNEKGEEGLLLHVGIEDSLEISTMRVLPIFFLEWQTLIPEGYTVTNDEALWLPIKAELI